MAQMKARKNGAWVSVPNGTTIKVEKNGSLVNPTKIQARKNGAWYTVWNKSDPLTLAFTCNGSQGWRNNAWRTDGNVRFGAWTSNAPSAGGTFYGDNLSVLEFSADSTTGGHTSTSLAEALAVRPNVTSATLYIYREAAGYGTIPSTSETLLVGQLNKANGTSMSSYNAGSFVQTTNMQTIPASDLIGWGQNAAKTFTLPSSGLTDFITHVSTKQMWVSELSTGWVASGGSGSFSQIYTVGNGSGDSNPPVLTVTLDY